MNSSSREIKRSMFLSASMSLCMKPEVFLKRNYMQLRLLKYLFWFIIIFLTNSGYSQETNLPDVIVAIAEELAAEDPDPESVSAYVEKLQELAENPVQLNSAGEEEISRLFFLSEFQVKALADYIHSSGIIISVYEIANIPGFDKEITEMIIPFIGLKRSYMTNPDSARWVSTLITNLSVRSGIKDSSDLGSPLKILSKYKFMAGNFTGGFTVEKDAGERLLTGNPPKPDFMSSYISFTGRGLIRRIIIGDFSARFGQGCSINTGIGTGLSLTSAGYMTARNEIKQYTSTDENNFFRGAAGEFSLQNFSISAFYSKNYSDATLGSSNGSVYDCIESFYTSGLHSTPSLNRKKDAISDLAYGINLTYNFNTLRIGGSWSEDRLSLPVRTAAGNFERVSAFSGDRNTLYSLYYNCLIKRFLLYGEYSFNKSARYAFVQGLSFRPSDRLTINFLLRNYEAGYSSLHGKGPGSVLSTGNGKSILGNFIFEAAKHLFISAGCEVQSFPWLKYRCSSPSRGVRQEIRARYLPSGTLTFEASYSRRLSMVDGQESIGIPEPDEIISQNIKFLIRYLPYENLTLGTRSGYRLVDRTGSRGMFLSQDIGYKFRSVPITLWLRYCIFNTDDWDSRIYLYENDLLYSFSIPALSGAGSRSYIMVKWVISDFAEMRLKYGATALNNKVSVTENNNEVKVQFKLRF